MALKRELHINCPDCGKQQRGRREANGYWYEHCDCKKVPGPINAPRVVTDATVIWIK